MRIALAAVFALAAVSASAQTIVAVFDLTKFDRGAIVGTPRAIDTDGDPATTEWLVRYEDASVTSILPTYASAVVRTAPDYCVGLSFLGGNEAAPNVVPQLANGVHTLHVRSENILTVLSLDTPVCHD